MIRGPKPQPTHLRLVRGNPGKRAIKDDHPKPKIEIPPAPAILKEMAVKSPAVLKEWKRLSRLLAGMGCLSKIDAGQLATYCVAWARWIEAEQGLQTTGLIVKAPSGYPILSPYYAIANKAMDQMRVLAAEFGMTPSSRSRITASEPAAPDDPAEGYFTGKGKKSPRSG